jgi:DNA adenine methylase
VKPFLKWAGGKRWLFDSSFVSSLPTFQRYVEPFVGGGAGFFKLKPGKAILSDLNPDVIEIYRVVRDQPKELAGALRVHHESHDRNYYYDIRGAVPDTKLERAARTLYLNRTCWNGLYRVNRQGKFNVPIGTKIKVLDEDEDFSAYSKILIGAELMCCDFADTIDRCGEGDLLFVDPPYTVKHNFNGFVKYNESIFTWSDQVRLAAKLREAAIRGADVVMTNADHPSVRTLYDPISNPVSVGRASVISGTPNGRGKTTELVIRL